MEDRCFFFHVLSNENQCDGLRIPLNFHGSSFQIFLEVLSERLNFCDQQMSLFSMIFFSHLLYS